MFIANGRLGIQKELEARTALCYTITPHALLRGGAADGNGDSRVDEREGADKPAGRDGEQSGPVKASTRGVGVGVGVGGKP